MPHHAVSPMENTEQFTTGKAKSKVENTVSEYKLEKEGRE